MLIDSVTSSSAAGSGSTGVTTGADPGNQLDQLGQLGQDTFLKLMVAQLRNQDPMNPTDSTQFLAQTAQFTSVEKLTTVADQTTQALALQREFGASSLVGRTVSYAAADGSHAAGTVASVRFADSGPVLEIGSDEVSLDNVLGVSA